MYSYRRIKRGEFNLYKSIRLESLKDSPGAFGSTFESSAARSQQSWVEQADGGSRGSDRAIFFALNDEHVVGLAALYRLDSRKNTAELMQVWVRPEHRRKGVVIALMDFMFEWALKNEISAIVAGIMSDNAGAMRFYQKQGFEPVSGIVLDCPGDAAVLIKDLK